jgi:hypothetical protein
MFLWQWIQEYFDEARSESIDIGSLPETSSSEDANTLA